MKKTLGFFCMAALVLMGAAMNGCTSSELVNEQPENNDKIVTLTTTVGFDAASTKALADGGVKTFADGDKIAVIYKNTSGETVKAVSEAISSGAGTSSAAFTVTLTNPNKAEAIRYIYPAAMAKETVATDATINDAGTVDFTKLNSQEGTLADLGSKYDLCTLDAGDWTSGELPTGSLANQLAILAITLKDVDGGNESTDNITGDITGMTISDGTNTYAVGGLSSASKIYVAIRPTTNAKIWISATTGTKNYTKSLTKTYEANNGYSVSWRMATVGDVILSDGTFAKVGTAGAVAKIFYVGSETGEAAYGFTHGLALAMSDANGGNGRKWSLHEYTYHSSSKQESSSFRSESGLQYIATENTDDFPAFQAAIANNGTPAPTGCSDWFLPSGYQWNKMINAAGGYTTLRASAGLDQKGAACYYWSSSENGSTFAWRLMIYVNPSTHNDESGWSANNKVTNDFYLVRSALAF